ncbi:hypothetical protein C0993_004591 [Termitomyces sp. T159_Od127]|nr:hypothetical protein C0993_004591 [Termitomyces sp. T159_Od127]
MSSEVQKHDQSAIRGTVKYAWNNPNNVFYRNLKVDKAAKNFAKVVGGSSYDFLESLYTIYLDTKSNAAIFNAIIIVNKIESSISRYQAKILQLTGIGHDWKHSKEVWKDILNVLKSLQDLGYTVSLESNHEDIIKLHGREELLYQSLLL